MTTKDPERDVRYEKTLQASLKTTEEIVVRVYVIKAQHLRPKDRNGLSDPYLRVQLGRYCKIEWNLLPTLYNVVPCCVG